MNPSGTKNKRKADLLDADEFESVECHLFAKRLKGALGVPIKNIVMRPSFCFVTRVATTFTTNIRGLISLDSAALFLLDAAPDGRISTYGDHYLPKTLSKGIDSSLNKADVNANRFFDIYIHKDTPEEEMTNLLEHNTHVLDLSSDEERKQKARREKAEGSDKENIPPVDDVSLTFTRGVTGNLGADATPIEKKRLALRETTSVDFYADGSGETSVTLVRTDDEEQDLHKVPVNGIFEFASKIGGVNVPVEIVKAKLQKTRWRPTWHCLFYQQTR